MSRATYLLLPVHPFSDFFLLDPRTSLNNACQLLFGKNSSKMPQYVYDSRGPAHDRIWTAIIYSQFPLNNFVINHLIYGFTVEGIEYGRGEGKNQRAAGDAAATQALSELRNQYGDTGN